MKRISFAFLLFLSIFSCQSQVGYPQIQTILFNGNNNQNWQKPPSLPEHIYKATGFNEVNLTNQPGIGLPVPHEFGQNEIREKNGFSWLENDSTFALLKDEQIVWQFNFNTRYQKPFFHPVYVNKNLITCQSPDDHPWHLGQWFSWKYINNVNFWEYTSRKSYQMEGLIDIKVARFEKHLDYSADIHLNMDYYIEHENKVLTEESIIRISPPHKDGHIQMDYEMNFTAVAEQVELNRTPPVVSEPDGVLGGGYSGLSIRFNQNFVNSRILSSSGLNYQYRGRDPEKTHGYEELAIINSGYKHMDEKTGNWLYMGFTGPDEKQVGTAIMISKDTKGQGEAWYSVNRPEVPFYFFGPAYVYLKPKILTRGERIKLKYRILHLEGTVNNDILNQKYDRYAIPKE